MHRQPKANNELQTGGDSGTAIEEKDQPDRGSSQRISRANRPRSVHNSGGKDPEEMIHYFGAQKKIFKIHFRNVSAPLPHFIETFMDNGYYDMYKIMKALRDTDYDGIVIPDHLPRMGPPVTPGGAAQGRAAGDPYGRATLAYSIAYMRALRDRADREAKG
jgi:hypothetical protein